MKSARPRLRRIVPVLIVLSVVLFGRVRGAETRGATPVTAPGPTAAPSPAERGLDLGRVETREHRAQIERVVEAMDRTGSPPPGVAQGGRRGARKGVFLNAEGRLPRKPRGYWIESDVWPRNGPRDAERLIFGREGEVYWTRDHYETFVRLR
ncbi:MAG: hypothetical protein K1Y01_06155 [Vicinamibacteria bacterium]|nr:hypothetical protein [Vicinamibacteria bacterium]